MRNKIDGLDGVLKDKSDAIRNAGLKKLFSAHHVLVSAPPGFTFVKPSQKRSTLFLRTEEALTDVEGVQFLAFALLHRLKQRDEAYKGHLDVIYIDSMGIASVAYALREMYCAMYGAPRPRVVSFHSHDGIEHVDTPLPGTSFCLISASSSLNLERDWQRRTRCHCDEVVTLLTLDDAQGFENALFALRSPEIDGGPQAAKHLRDLPIVGERFAPADLMPKKVLLRKSHKEKQAEDFCRKFVTTGRLGIQGRGIGSGKVRPLYLSAADFKNTPKFDDFLNRALQQQTVASVSAVVHQDDEASESLAKECAARLARIMVRISPPRVINEKRLGASQGAVDPKAGLLVVAAVVGRGTRLLSISRDLRDIHEGARTYLIGAQIADTANQIHVLTNNLTYSATKANIQIVRFTQIATGAGLGESFGDEARLLQNAGAAFGEEYGRRTAAIAGTREGLNANTFIGLNDDLTEPMKLRLDFAFWDFDYDAQTASTTSSVFAMVGAILQNARENGFKDQSLRLSTDAFQQVILDPENFTRYNDGVIQAALLRCARVGELDYSKEKGASQFMLDLLKSIFGQHDKRQGEAAAEFALALRLKKLRLHSEHELALVEHLRDELYDNSPRIRLIRALLGLDPMPDMGRLPAEF
ncbi:hypothetical protein WT62_18575 [Burkholderia stagnalis]|nr:hypothetical protein WT62_18575 [Burkholderia stagnalis]